MPWCTLRLIPIAGLVFPRMTELGNHAIANISHGDTKRIVNSRLFLWVIILDATFWFLICSIDLQGLDVFALVRISMEFRY